MIKFIITSPKYDVMILKVILAFLSGDFSNLSVSSFSI
jgi:hypothetical protein